MKEIELENSSREGFNINIESIPRVRSSSNSIDGANLLQRVENTKLIADRCEVHMEFTKAYYNELISAIDNDKD